MVELFANSGDPDQMQQKAVSALFASYPFGGLQSSMGLKRAVFVSTLYSHSQKNMYGIII